MCDNWTPELIVGLVNALAWPLTVIVVALSLRLFLGKSFRNLFSESKVSEFSVSKAGISTKFVANKQTIEGIGSSTNRAISSAERDDVDVVRENQQLASTEYSEDIFRTVNLQLDRFPISKEDKLELIARDYSLIQCALQYNNVKTALFRSQYDLLRKIQDNTNSLLSYELEQYVQDVLDSNPKSYPGWDFQSYAAYLVSTGLIVEDAKEYRLTKFGRSFVTYMSRNPQFVDQLSRL